MVPPSIGIIILTDGIVGLPDAALFESLMIQLRHNSIAVSFLQIGHWLEPQAGFGQVPYNELMQFIATATFGSYFTKIRDKVSSDGCHGYLLLLIFLDFFFGVYTGEVQLSFKWSSTLVLLELLGHLLWGGSPQCPFSLLALRDSNPISRNLNKKYWHVNNVGHPDPQIIVDIHVFQLSLILYISFSIIS